MALLFDIETNGFLDQTNMIHVLVIKDTKTKEVFKFQWANARVGVDMLAFATRSGTYIVAHNGIKFDVPVIKKLFPDVKFDEDFIRDTLVMTRLMFPDLLDNDLRLIEKGKLPKKMLKSHSLEAWGYRLGEHKIDYLEWCEMSGIEDPWGSWSQEMEDYCVQDVVTMEKLWEFLLKQNYAEYPITLEHQVALIVARQERYGIYFDMAKASALYAKLVDHRTRLEEELRRVFPPNFKGHKGKPRVGEFYTLEQLAEKGHTPPDSLLAEGCKYFRILPFNPGSRDQVANALKKLYDWVPKEYTNDGKPKVDETILNALKYPEAKLLAEYYMVAKRIGQVAEGDEAWLRHVKADGRIHGGVITNGAVTGRMTHARPNIAQVPAGYSPYGHECRECFTVPPGKRQVGADASALELRCLAGYMALWDEGAYIKTVTEGKKEDGTEIHTVNRKALQIESRDDAKTWFYAFIYGAGDEKLGSILLKKKGNQARQRGKASRDAFLKNLPALGKFVNTVQQKVKKNKVLKGLDGRWLHIRSQHAALNTLLQSAGAIIMKVALVVLDKRLQAMGYVPGVNYEFIANVHDEWQIECDADIAEAVGVCAVEAMEQAGRDLKFRCPITGESRTGSSWAETH